MRFKSLKEMEKGSRLFPLLTKTEQAAYSGWFNIMIGAKFKMDVADAHRESALLLAKTSRELYIRKYVQRFRMDDYIKIFSLRLNRKIGVVRYEGKKRFLNADPGDLYSAEEIANHIREKALLDDKELPLMMEALKIFNGVLVSHLTERAAK